MPNHWIKGSMTVVGDDPWDRCIEARTEMEGNMDTLVQLGSFLLGIGVLLGGVAAIWWVSMQTDN